MGGTASELSGGKFANGAITGAFSRAFNDEVEAHRNIEMKISPTDAINDAIDNVEKNQTLPFGRGICAKIVVNGLNSAGFGVPLLSDGHGYAKDFGPSLESAGFEIVDVTKEEYLNGGARRGDVVLIDSVGPDRPAGHMQIFDGQQWHSDFPQPGFYPGQAYIKAQSEFRVYRYRTLNQ
jgi:hypothetical protein